MACRVPEGITSAAAVEQVPIQEREPLHRAAVRFGSGMARPDWPALDRDGREAALVQLLALCGADAEFWTMPEHRQRRVARQFAGHFLDAGESDQPAAGRPVAVSGP